MRQYFMVLAEICQAGLNDSSAEVQRVALQAITGLGEWASEKAHEEAIRSLLPSLFKVRALASQSYL